jgi:hypothetical protein
MLVQYKTDFFISSKYTLEKTEGKIKNGQSRYIGYIGNKRHKTVNPGDQELLTLLDHLGLHRLLSWVLCFYLFSVLCGGFSFCWLRLVSFVPNVANVSGLSVDSFSVS